MDITVYLHTVSWIYQVQQGKSGSANAACGVILYGGSDTPDQFPISSHQAGPGNEWSQAEIDFNASKITANVSARLTAYTEGYANASIQLTW